MSEQVLYIKLPKEMKKQLQIIAIKKETTMTDIIQELVSEYITENR